MRAQGFQSEYDAAQLPDTPGRPLVNKQPDALVATIEPGRRVEGGQQALVLDAVATYYLAKRWHDTVLAFDGHTNATVPRALDAVGTGLLRLAVVAVASVNDHDPRGRTRSLPHVIHALLAAIADVDAEDERAVLTLVKADINPDLVRSLEYVRHVRNKWAGHSSLDLEYDPWAQPEEGLSLPLVEDALVRLVNAHQQVADLLAGSPAMARLRSRADGAEDSSSVEGVIEMGVDWGATTVLADMHRAWAGRAADALLDQLASPPGYGSPEDTDWAPGSEHDRRRTLIDRAASKVDFGR